MRRCSPSPRPWYEYYLRRTNDITQSRQIVPLNDLLHPAPCNAVAVYRHIMKFKADLRPFMSYTIGDTPLVCTLWRVRIHVHCSLTGTEKRPSVFFMRYFLDYCASQTAKPAILPRVREHGRIKTILGLMLQQWRRVDRAKGRARLRRPSPLHFPTSLLFIMPFLPLSSPLSFLSLPSH